MQKKDEYAILREKYHSAAYARSNVLDGRFQNMMHIYERMYGQFMPAEKSAKIVDIACGAGQFLKYCINKGYWNIKGVDLSEEQVEYAKANVTGKVISGDGFDYLKDNRNAFDLVIANDFIEHITKAKGLEFVKLCIEALKPGGRIILKTGNMAAFGGLVIWCNGIDHECGYTERSLHTLLAINGFEQIILIPYMEKRRLYNWSQRAFSMVLRLLYKYIYAGNYPKIYTKNIAVTGVKP